MRLGLVKTLVLDAMAPEVATAYERAVQVLTKAGMQVSEAHVDLFAGMAQVNARGGFAAAEAYAWHRELIARAATSTTSSCASGSSAAARSAPPTTST